MFCSKTTHRLMFAVTIAFACIASLSLRSHAFADAGFVEADALSRKKLADRLEPFYRIWSGKEDRFALRVNGNLQIKGEPQSIQIDVSKFDDQSFDFVAVHPEYAVSVHRTEQMTAMVLPKHHKVFVGTGAVEGTDTLVPLEISTRLASNASQIGPFVQMLGQGDAASLILLASSLIKIEQIDGQESWRLGGTVKVWFDPSDVDGPMHVAVDGNELTVSLLDEATPVSPTTWSKLEQVSIDRSEMEEQFSRGIRRAWEVVWPSRELTQPKTISKKTAHGQLKYVEGQRLVVLAGTPEQIGTAHGELLKDESQRCIDSVLNAFGSVQTIASGRWFRHDLAAAYARLRPFIPPDHIAETRALAVSLGQSPELLEQLNVFPEMFHCSGFAVFNSATVDGKLYHGRVLDYMTTIGLQDAATTFVVSVDGKIPFANVGYAGFTGSVSGMNMQAISLGEMGGRGEGQWDGVPMATLMRRALEECSTLEQVTDLWTKSPRTCEYYYVFADGKTNDAVGVAATPEKIELIRPGQADERLGEGIKDAVVLSAGSRLETLRARVTENHGKIDTQKAMWLMSRPVAMSSNLHNVLFIPADRVFYVANADHDTPAADRPYVKFDLNALLGESGLISVVEASAQDATARDLNPLSTR